MKKEKLWSMIFTYEASKISLLLIRIKQTNLVSNNYIKIIRAILKKKKKRNTKNPLESLIFFSKHMHIEV